MNCRLLLMGLVVGVMGCSGSPVMCGPGTTLLGDTCVASGGGSGGDGAGGGTAGAGGGTAGGGSAGGGSAGGGSAGGGSAGGGSAGGGSAGGGATGGATGTCASPTPIAFVNDAFETSGFLVGANGDTATCSGGAAAGPDLAFSVSLSSPAYLFAMQEGNATSFPTLKLHDGACSTALLACDRETYGPSSVGIRSNALAPGNYVVVADSQAGNGGTYGLWVSRSTVLGDGCSDARPVTLTGTTVTLVGDTTGMTTTLDATCDNGTAKDALFSFTAPRSGTLTVQVTPASGVTSVLSIRSGASCTSSMELSNACQGSSLGGDPHTVSVAVAQGTTYWVRVAGYYSFSEGAYRIRFDLP